jgi:hypothetical protein
MSVYAWHATLLSAYVVVRGPSSAWSVLQAEELARRVEGLLVALVERAAMVARSGAERDRFMRAGRDMAGRWTTGDSAARTYCRVSPRRCRCSLRRLSSEVDRCVSWGAMQTISGSRGRTTSAGRRFQAARED